MDCSKAKELLIEHMDGLLKADERDALEGHLASCKDCSIELRRLTEARSALRSARRFTAPEGFAYKVMGEIKALDDEPGFWGWLWSMPSYMKLAQAAAVAAIVLTGVYSAGLLSDGLMGSGVVENGETSLVASIGAEYLDSIPPESIGEIYLSTEENGNEKQVP